MGMVSAYLSSKYLHQVQEYPSLFQQRTKIDYVIRGKEEEANTSQWTISIDAFQRDSDDGLFVNHIWEGAIVLADYIVDHHHLFHNRSVLELGAGCALPSLVVSKFAPSKVICTDYHDVELLEYIRSNTITNNSIEIEVRPFNWTDDPQNLRQFTSKHEGFDYIFCAELLWKDTFHLMPHLFTSMKALLKDQTSKIFFCFAERTCEGFTHDIIITQLDHLLETNGLQPKQLLLVSKQYVDAIEFCPSTVYLYEFSMQEV